MKIKAIIETAIYVADLQAAESFYGTMLGLRVMGKEHLSRLDPGERQVVGGKKICRR